MAAPVLAIGIRKSATADLKSSRRFSIAMAGMRGDLSARLQSQSTTRSAVSAGRPSALNDTASRRSPAAEKSAANAVPGLDSRSVSVSRFVARSPLRSIPSCPRSPLGWKPGASGSRSRSVTPASKNSS